jgi:hypothetical protein
LTNSEGNHGEDVKEYYFYLDSTPTHSYMKYLYKYPQAAFPYADLVETNRRRNRICLRDEHGRRPVYGGTEKFQTDPHWSNHILFYEYFHGDNGAGLARATRPAGPDSWPNAFSFSATWIPSGPWSRARRLRS